MYTLNFDGSLTGKTKKSNYAGAAWALFDDTGKQIAHGISSYKKRWQIHIEYQALIDGLAYIILNNYNHEHIKICGDCAEVLDKLQGKGSVYTKDTVKNLFDCAANMLTILDSYELIHIDRKYNKLCDAYSRYALDYGVII